jgi:hypothetical protein
MEKQNGEEKRRMRKWVQKLRQSCEILNTEAAAPPEALGHITSTKPHGVTIKTTILKYVYAVYGFKPVTILKSTGPS